MKGLYSDAFTTQLQLPDGFGIYYTPDDDLQWMPMFNNRGEQPVRVAMRVELTLVRSKDLKKPMRRLFSTLPVFKCRICSSSRATMNGKSRLRCHSTAGFI